MSIIKSLLLLVCLSSVDMVRAGTDIHIIPRPESMTQTEGNFTLNAVVAVVCDESTKQEANYLAEKLEQSFGEKPSILSAGKGIRLYLNADLKNDLGEEGYNLRVNSDGIDIEGASSAGVFYGIQSLRQLLPPDFEMRPDKNKTVNIPVLAIHDKPRFSWRAFMLDEARHFKGMDVVKKMLEQMALLKMNVFHWHLTDDQGWRIEIKKYPQLTLVGGTRKDTQLARRSEKREGVPHSGYYTQEQIREIIAFAAQRHIRIVPEIEMPGHAMAAIAAYPWLSTLGIATEVPVTFGKLDDSFNIADPKVNRFLKDVLTEVFVLFPGKIVHIGGDEVKFDAWNNSAEMQDMMKKKGLTSPADLQIYFTNQMSQFIEKSGFRMMGWNEILGDNIHEWQDAANMDVKQSLSKSAIIHFWKGNIDLLNKAVSNGYEVVNSYHAQTYLDYDYTAIPLAKAYAFDPVPQGLDMRYEKKVLGLGCQMWSEWIPTVPQMERQVFPRLAAYAEVGWTSVTRKNFDVFSLSLAELEKRWTLMGIAYKKD